ncbi:MAG: hypothetical protein V2A58_01255, partial [Planctomycetota bacterium]
PLKMQGYLTTLVVFTLALAGCGRGSPTNYGLKTPARSGRLLEVKRPARDLGTYEALEIADFENALPGIIPPDLPGNLSGELALRAQLGGRFTAVRQVAPAQALTPTTDKPTLLLTGRLIDVDTAKSNPETKRRAPLDFLTAEIAITDTSTGQVLGRFVATGYAPPSVPEKRREQALIESLSDTILQYLGVSKP